MKSTRKGYQVILIVTAILLVIIIVSLIVVLSNNPEQTETTPDNQQSEPAVEQFADQLTTQLTEINLQCQPFSVSDEPALVNYLEQ